MIVLGSTNVGKSTFLNNLMQTGSLLITNEMRETSCFWNIKFFQEAERDQDSQYSMISKFLNSAKGTRYNLPQAFPDLKELKKGIREFKISEDKKQAAGSKD